jgi:hypothetical protein
MHSDSVTAESKYHSSDDEKSPHSRYDQPQKTGKSLYDEEEERAERNLHGRLPRGGRHMDKGYSSSDGDEDFDRDFYLSEEAQTLRDDSSATVPFLGNSKKFKEREEVMAKSRSRGDTKIAGLCYYCTANP